MPKKQLSPSPLETGKKLMPAHKLGGDLTNSDELASNIAMGKGAQGDAVVHKRQTGITGKGIGRHGRKGRTR